MAVGDGATTAACYEGDEGDVLVHAVVPQHAVLHAVAYDGYVVKAQAVVRSL